MSEWLSETYAEQAIPAVPHVVEPWECSQSLRTTLGIPEDAFVVGSYGSPGSLNIEFAKQAILSAANERSSLWFVFMNLPVFAEHPRIIFLPGSSAESGKAEFVNTCDAMVHARYEGETFGLACAEFSARNKPIIAYACSCAKHHMWVLGENIYLYSSQLELYDLLIKINKMSLEGKRFDAYSSRYTPERVMEAFDRHLIHPCRSVTRIGLAKTVFMAQTDYELRSLTNRLRKLLKRALANARLI